MRATYYHSLQQELTNKGVDSVAGFHEIISMSKTWWYMRSFCTYAHQFWPQISLAQAHLLALDDVVTLWGDTFGLESFDYTANIGLRPARWGE